MSNPTRSLYLLQNVLAEKNGSPKTIEKCYIMRNWIDLLAKKKKNAFNKKIIWKNSAPRGSERTGT